jgi:NTP pyrophosphatase (non-canonical NTP hydrolase)
MDDRAEMTLHILQEECAEVVVAVSKINRFGVNSFHPASTRSNLDHLEEEIGDVLAMIDLLLSQGVINQDNLDLAKAAKFEKLKKWSKIYD